MNTTYWIAYLLFNNKEALLSLPTEVKMILLACTGIVLLGGVISKAFQLVKIAVLIAICYFVAVYCGII